MDTALMAFWLFMFPMLVQWVWMSFGPDVKWPMAVQGTWVPHAEYDPACNGIGTGPCATCAKGPKQ